MRPRSGPLFVTLSLRFSDAFVVTWKEPGGTFTFGRFSVFWPFRKGIEVLGIERGRSKRGE